MDFLLAGVGLVILLLAGDALVRGAVNLALRLGVPALLVSLTVVAFGTSAPELLVSVQAVLLGAPGIAVGNVVGSNIANVLLVLGLPALIAGIAAHEHDVRRSYTLMLGATALFVVLAFLGPLTWWHGLILVGALAAVLTSQAREAMAHRRAGEEPVVELEGVDPHMPWWKIGVFTLVGLIGLPLGADLLVDNATRIAQALGISDAVIGLTLVAIGTSLPELATTVVAAFRRQADVALGNVIGSNMFNMLGILGIAALVGPIPIERSFLVFDFWVMAAAALALVPAVFLGHALGKRWGTGFLLVYALYLWAVVSGVGTSI